MARGLLDYYRFDRRHPGEFMHVSQCCNHESSQLIWWDLLEEELVLRPDGGRAGFWRITEIGRRFVEGEITLTKKAMIYDHTKLSMEGPQVTFAQVLKKPFDLQELMSG
jgi:hypothetical protein